MVHRVEPWEFTSWSSQTLPELIWWDVIADRFSHRFAARVAEEIAKHFKTKDKGKCWWAFISDYNQLSADDVQDLKEHLNKTNVLGQLIEGLVDFVNLYPACPMSQFLDEPPTGIVDANYLQHFTDRMRELENKRSRSGVLVQAQAIYMGFVLGRRIMGSRVVPLPQLPHSPEAERAVLGAVLVADALPNPALKTAAEELCSSDFFLSQHQRIFARMLELDANRQPIEFVTLFERLEAAGELDVAGGAPFLAQLGDGIPKVSNVAHYARIVREKAVRRMIVHAGQRLSETALMPTASLEKISQQLHELPKIVIPSRQTRGLTAVTAEAFLGMQLPEREMIIDPILATQSLALLYAPRGVGKTFFAAAIAHTVATGGSLFGWRAPKPRNVLFVDGELPARVLRDRICVIAEAAQSKASLERLHLVTPDLQSAPMPDLATAEGQACIEACLDGVGLVILDNLSALCRSGKENEGEGWLPVQEWALRLRQRGIAVLFVHHAGKGGAQRGTSRREDVLDLVLALRRPTDYSPIPALLLKII